jgi:hypothetical protein
MYGVLYCTQSVTLCDLIFSFELPIDTYILIITRVLIERNGDSRKEKNAIRFRLNSLFQQSCSCYCDFVRIKRKTKKIYNTAGTALSNRKNIRKRQNRYR